MWNQNWLRRLFAKTSSEMQNAEAADTASSPFPLEFDPDFYRSQYSNLRRMDDSALREHYEKRGRLEGRIATSAVPRDNFIKLVPDNSVLEIGPFVKPVMRGPKVKYFDLMSRDQLIERATRTGIVAEKVPEIDFVSPHGDLSIVDQKFFTVISSHCIEHQPDMLRHLRQVENILEDGGCYFLLIPDKRYCFDHFLPESTIAEIIEAHREGRTVHTLSNVIKCIALTAHNDPVRYWNGDAGKRPLDPKKIEAAIHAYDDAKGNYLDVHSLYFTPASFRDIMATLCELRLTRLEPERVYDTPKHWNEFCAILRKV
jgi:SAM-dependent methyltransferase